MMLLVGMNLSSRLGGGSYPSWVENGSLVRHWQSSRR